MNQRLIIILSVVIICVSVIGIMSNTPKQPVVETQQTQIPKQSYTFLVALRDLNKGEIIRSSDIISETIQDEAGKHFGNTLVNKNKDYVLDALVLESIPKGGRLDDDRIAILGSAEYERLKVKPKQGYYSFGFNLNERDLGILQNLKPSEYVDIYFKYQTRNKRSIAVLPKRDNNTSTYTNQPAESSNLFLLLADKKALFKEQKYINASQDEEAKIQNILHVELSSEEIKRVYAIENVGEFYIFPASKDSVGILTTEHVLPKDFIKQHRGGADGQNESF